MWQSEPRINECKTRHSLGSQMSQLGAPQRSAQISGHAVILKIKSNVKIQPAPDLANSVSEKDWSNQHAKSWVQGPRVPEKDTEAPVTGLHHKPELIGWWRVGGHKGGWNKWQKNVKHNTSSPDKHTAGRWQIARWEGGQVGRVIFWELCHPSRIYSRSGPRTHLPPLFIAQGTSE